MDRYLVFMYDTYYPGGGMNDLVGSANNKEEIRELILENPNREYVDILDTKTKEIPVKEFKIEADYEYELDLENVEKLLTYIKEDN